MIDLLILNGIITLMLLNTFLFTILIKGKLTLKTKETIKTEFDIDPRRKK